MSGLGSSLLPLRGMDDHEYAALPSMLESDERDAQELYHDELADPTLASLHTTPFVLREKKRPKREAKIENLDAWCTNLYQYFEGSGFWCILVSRVLNILTLGFTVFFSGFLLLYVDWRTLGTKCAEASLRSAGGWERDGNKTDADPDGVGLKDTCDILKDATYANPLSHRSFFVNLTVLTYLCLFTLYLLFSVVKLVFDVPQLRRTRTFCNAKLGLSDHDIQTITWPEVLARVVHLQNTTKLCIVKELNEHDIVARILRKENYLLGMLNRDVLGLRFRGMRGVGNGTRQNKVWFTKTIEYHIHQCVLNNMFDDDFGIKDAFFDVDALRQRMRLLAVVNLLLAPFVAIFLTIYFLLHHVERFYHNPGSLGLRQWSTWARWTMREFNELEHFLEQRLRASHRPASRYVQQFSSPIVSLCARFVSYLVGAFVAFALACTLLLDDRLLHAEIFGRDLLWHTAVLGTVLAASRGAISEETTAFDPNLWMRQTVRHTHYLPKRWRHVAHSKTTMREFSSMFKFRSAIFLEELLSVFVAPFLLWGPLCESAPEIVTFVRTFTTHAPGIGAVCGLSNFDFQKHGNSNYGAPNAARKQSRSKQGKMEKSFLSFTTRYPSWEPCGLGRPEMLRGLHEFKDLWERDGENTVRHDTVPDGRESGRGMGRSSTKLDVGVGVSWAPANADGRFPSPGSGSVFGESRSSRFGAHGETRDTYDAPTSSKIGFFGHGRVACAEGAHSGDDGYTGEDRTEYTKFTEDRTWLMESQVLLQRAYEANAFGSSETRSDVERSDRPFLRAPEPSANSSRATIDVKQSLGSPLPVLTPVPCRSEGKDLRIDQRGFARKKTTPAETEMVSSVSVSPPAFAPRPAPPNFAPPPNLWELESEDKKHKGGPAL